jgi:hypothetical protein
MLAVANVTRHAEIKALTATFVTSDLLSGANEEIAPIIIPTDAGFAKLQMANVAMAEDLNCKKFKIIIFFLKKIISY